MNFIEQSYSRSNFDYSETAKRRDPQQFCLTVRRNHDVHILRNSTHVSMVPNCPTACDCCFRMNRNEQALQVSNHSSVTAWKFVWVLCFFRFERQKTIGEF